MQLTNTPGKLVLPFANAGAKNTIPTASQIGITAGAASLTDGFPPLTRTPIAAGGVPPSGLDMNGILYELSAILRWANAGGGYAYDAAFATDSNVGGYPKGARIMRSDGLGYWFNTVENNTTDPEAAGAAAAGWVPDFTNGVTSVAMASANVTLTPLQYGKPIIVITGTLTANLNLIFPAIVNEWTVINNTTGPYTITCKTAAGTGLNVNTAALIVGDGTNIQSAVTDAAALFGETVSTATGGTADAITATFSPVPRYASNGVPLKVRATAANATTTPTFTPNSGVIAAATIVKGNNLPLAIGDIAGAGHWLELAWDSTLSKWVLLNPANGVQGVTDANLQNQTYTAFTTGGVSGTFTLTPAPALTSYAAGQRFRVKFSAAGNGSDTINVSALGAKNLKQYDSAGNKVAPVIASGCLFDVEYDGVDFVILDPLPLAVSVQGAFKNLTASATGLNANVSVAADEIVVEDANNNYKTLRAVSLTIAGTSVGANALDAGTIAASTWYSVWVIYNPTTRTTAGLLSLSSTAPTLPSGYTLKARVGWIRTDGTANKYPLSFIQAGRRVQYKAAAGSNVLNFPFMASGVAGTVSSSAVTYSAVAVANYVPPTAVAIGIVCHVEAAGAQVVAAPNSAYSGGWAGTTSPPPFLFATNAGAAQTLNAGQFFLLESANIYYASNVASNYMSCSGWEDNI